MILDKSNGWSHIRDQKSLLIMMTLGPIGLQHHVGRCFFPWVELTTEGIAPQKPALKPILSARTTTQS
jgi:hypothetical protein